MIQRNGINFGKDIDIHNVIINGGFEIMNDDIQK